jgi:hypothetical protein
MRCQSDKVDCPGDPQGMSASKYLALWRSWSGYHRKSRVETTLSGITAHYPAGQQMHCMKLLGQRLMVVRHCRSDQSREMAQL